MTNRLSLTDTLVSRNDTDVAEHWAVDLNDQWKEFSSFRKMVKFSLPCGHMVNMSSMYLDQMLGVFEVRCKRALSNLSIKISV